MIPTDKKSIDEAVAELAEMQTEKELREMSEEQCREIENKLAIILQRVRHQHGVSEWESQQ